MRMSRWILGIAVMALLLLLAARWLMNNRPQPLVPPVLPVSHPQHHAALPPKPPELMPVEEPVAVSGATTNAADIYRQAFAAFGALTDDEKKALWDWKNEVDPATAAALCGKLQPITDLLHRASAVTNCDWGLEPMRLDLLPRKVAQAANWSAAHCRWNDGAGAANDFVAALRLGQKIPPNALGFLVQTAIAHQVMECVAANAGTLRGAPAARLIQALTNSQYEESYYRSLESEADLHTHEADQLASLSPTEAQKYLAQITNTGEGTPMMDVAQAVAGFRQVADWERDYGRASQLPEAEYQAWVEKWRAAQQENFIVGQFSPAWDSVLDMTRSAVVRRSLVLAGLAVLQDGPDAGAKYPDPATGQAFTYRETETGFELRSAYQWDHQPVTMAFRTR